MCVCARTRARAHVCVCKNKATVKVPPSPPTSRPPLGVCKEEGHSEWVGVANAPQSAASLSLGPGLTAGKLREEGSPGGPRALQRQGAKTPESPPPPSSVSHAPVHGPLGAAGSRWEARVPRAGLPLASLQNTDWVLGTYKIPSARSTQPTL